MFKMKTGFYLQLLTPETMKLIASTKNKKSKNENGGNVPNLKTTEVILIHCNIADNNCQQN